MTSRFTSQEVLTAILGAIAEWLFAILPLVIVALVMLHLGKSWALIESPEWAFGASVLAGQGLVKFVAGVAQGNKLALERVLFGVSGMIVIVVGPANAVLALVILSHEQPEHGMSTLLKAIQALLFCLSSMLFILIATFAHLWTKRLHVADNHLGG